MLAGLGHGVSESGPFGAVLRVLYVCFAVGSTWLPGVLAAHSTITISGQVVTTISSLIHDSWFPVPDETVWVPEGQFGPELIIYPLI